MAKKLSREVTLVVVVLILGLFAGSASATTIEDKIKVSTNDRDVFEFSVGNIGKISAEVRWDGTAEKLTLILNGPGQVGYYAREDGSSPLYLTYDVSEEDMKKGTEWRISVVNFYRGDADGFTKITYPSESDTPPPSVTENTPTGENVPVSTKVTITFSEPMNEESVEYGFSIYSKQFRVSGEFSWKENTMTFTPSSNLDYDTDYFVGLYDARDLAGNSLYEYYWNFRTEPPNNPPNTPNRPAGPSSGYIGRSYKYSTSAGDPDGDAIRYVFNWGDDTTSETEFVKSGEITVQSHAWNEPGEYNIRARAIDDRGASSEWSEPLIMVVHIPPTAIISATPTEITEGEHVSFSAESSRDSDGYIVYYGWDFGDGDTGAGINVEHTYSHSGHYTAALTVTDNDNLSASDTVGVTVKPRVLSISIFTDPVPSGESNEVALLVTANGDPVQDAFVDLSATIGDLDPATGATDADGGFVSIFTAPAVRVETMYTIHAEVAAEGELSGEGSVSDLITVPQETPPTAHIRIYPNPADEDESVTLEGWSTGAEGGEVVVYRWTFPDGSMRFHSSDSSQITLEPDEVVAGWYAFAVRDDDGMWSEEVGEELVVVVTEFPTEPVIPDVLVAITALAAGALLVYRVLRKPPGPKPDPNMKGKEDKNNSEDDTDEEQHGSIYATSDPTDAVVFVDRAYKDRSPKTIDNVLIGPHTVMFLKRGYFGYEKNAVVVANQTTPIHCDLTKIPEVKLKLSADPAEIVADGKSESTIGIEIMTKDKEIPIPVLEDTIVVLETDIGTIDSPVRIPRWHASATSTLRSSGSSGTATVKAEAEVEYEKIVKLEGSTTVEFQDGESE